MKINHIEGENKGRIMVYALSTCGWCKKAKALLSSLGIAYDYIDVDLLQGKEKDNVLNDIKKWNPKISFPTVIINDVCVIGFDEAKIKKELTK